LTSFSPKPSEETEEYFLEVDYEIKDKTGERRRLGLARDVQSICRSSGLVACRNDQCLSSQAIAQDLAAQLALQESNIPVSRVAIGSSSIVIFEGGQTALLFAAFGCWEPYIQRGECLACCVRTGCTNGWNEFAIVRTGFSNGIVRFMHILRYCRFSDHNYQQPRYLPRRKGKPDDAAIESGSSIP